MYSVTRFHSGNEELCKVVDDSLKESNQSMPTISKQLSGTIVILS